MVGGDADLVDIGFATAAGEPVGALLHGHTYQLVHEICFRADADNVSAVAYVKLKNGFVLGTLSAPEKNEAVAEGRVVAFSLIFNCILLPGTYMLDCQITGDCRGARKIMHTVIDLPVTVQSSIGLPGIGAINFSADPLERPL